MDREIFKLLTLIVVFGLCTSIPVWIFWLDHRNRTRALDVLRMYAERGEEPPASVLQAVARVSTWGDYTPAPHKEMRPPTRGGHLAHAAANTVFAIGLSWLAWWLFSSSGKASAGIIVSILAALFFAAAAAARLVGAYYARPMSDS